MSAPSPTVQLDVEHVRHPRLITVALRLSGAVLPRWSDEPEVPVDLDGLELLCRLVAGEPVPEPGTRTEAVDALVEGLRARGVLGPRPLGGGVDGSQSAAPDAPVADEAAPLAETVLVLPTPSLVRVVPDGYEVLDHDGHVRSRLSPLEVLAVLSFAMPQPIERAHDDHVQRAGDRALEVDAFTAFVERVHRQGVITRFDPSDPVQARRTRQTEAMAEGMRKQLRVHQAFDALEAEHDASSDRGAVPVVGFHQSWSGTPASLGMIIAAAKAHDGGRLTRAYDFRPRLVWDRQRFEAMAQRGPGIFLFSNYIWSTSLNLLHSALVKQVNPHSVTIHGGPNTPKYRPDVERFFADNPHVDIAVHGEGEGTFVHLLDALDGHVGDGPPDLSVLAEVPGLSFRDGDRIVTTGNRDRIAEVNDIPSPLLTGLFDGFKPAGSSGAVIIETNRGCPYGCTFCDWGSATLSRIRKFDLDRVFAELEWCATNGFETVGIADANFGIFERDVEIAEKIAELKATYGAPRFVGNNYAKNTVKHLSKIIEIFTEAGIVAEGKMSMQTFDSETLVAVHRKNIKVEKYYELAGEFRRNELPMMVDIMMGLPGATPATFRDDLQQCINRAVRVAIHTTLLLPNSPMNEPSYREEHGIVARPGEELRQTSSYTVDDWHEMNRLTWAYYVLENFGVLRYVATYVHAETEMREIDFYQRLVDDVDADPAAWPMIALVLKVLPEMMVPPISWALFLDEIKRYLVERHGIADDDALATVIAVQHALLPARDREFPLQLELAHDYGEWYADVVREREADTTDWPGKVRPLRERGPGTLPIDDPYEVCTAALGGSIRSLMVENAWDLASPISRPRQRLADDAVAMMGG